MPLEILAPVGSPEMLTAAVRCGTDAVYMGASAFHARRNSHSFGDAELVEAIAYAHAHGVKVHITLNTLIREEEMDKALSVAREAAAAGADALILQDVGLAAQIHKALPTLPLHASTQLSCHTPAGVKRLRQMGFSRVVLAREMTAEEIKACAGLGCELEIFVHGALCMSVSGQCYFSAMLGGRSGNRGACAQTCRLPFRADGSRDREAAALSLKDMSLLSHMGELADLGVCSLKIEGRMKRPEYVAAAVTVYRAASRGKIPDPQAMADLEAVFSRSGFTDGYLTGNRREMFGTRRHEDVTAAAPVLKRLARLYDNEVPRIPVNMTMAITAGQATALDVADGEGHTVRVVGDVPEIALHRPLDPARVEEQLRKTGGSPYVAENVSVEIGEGLTLPMATINGLRRQGLEKLTALRSAVEAREWLSDALPPLPPWSGRGGSPQIIAQYADEACVPADAGGADILFLPLHTPVERLAYWAAKLPVGVVILRGLFGTEGQALSALKRAANAGVSYALCGNVGGVDLALEAGLNPFGGFSLNITNPAALAVYADMGLSAATLSMELTFRQGEFGHTAPIPTGWLVYGRQALMLTRNCPRTSGALCGKGGCGGNLTDRMDKVFPLQCAGGCVEVLNADPLYWADRLEDLPQADFWLLSFTDETAEQAAAITVAYRTGGEKKMGITRGLYRRGVE